MSLVYVLISSVLAAAVNYCLRKNFEFQKSPQGYLALYFIFSFAISFILREVEFKSFSYVMSIAGIVTGSLNFLMMTLLSNSLRLGPAGLTFAFQNSASVFPSLLLYFIFGPAFGFQLTLPVILGFSLIVFGLFVSSWMEQQESHSSYRATFVKWFLIVITVFCIQGIILSLFQWRCLLMTHPESGFFVPWRCTLEEEAWFMPGFFLVPAILQTAIFGISERRRFAFRETFLGTAGGALNGGSTFLLLLATKQADIFERTLIFPLFAVGAIFLCSLWGRVIYGETIHWIGMILCFLGILVGSL